MSEVAYNDVFLTPHTTMSLWSSKAQVTHLEKKAEHVRVGANGRDGVAKYDLDVWIYMRTTMHAAFSKVVFRRLLCERTRKRRRALLKFVDRTIGHSYETNYANFVKAFFAVNSEESDLSTAFCSKLVAAAFQDIGVMSKERHADIFLPVIFLKSEMAGVGV